MNNPEITVTTPFGDVQVTVLDPIEEKASLKQAHEIPRLCYIHAAALRINRIAIKASGSIEIRTRNREVDGVDVPEQYANTRHSDWYARRLDAEGMADFSAEIPSGARSKLYNELPALIWEALKQAGLPELQKQARRVTLANAVETAKARIEATEKALVDAKRDYGIAVKELEKFATKA
jgi:hypothetical protein